MLRSGWCGAYPGASHETCGAHLRTDASGMEAALFLYLNSLHSQHLWDALCLLRKSPWHQRRSSDSEAQRWDGSAHQRFCSTAEYELRHRGGVGEGASAISDTFGHHSLSSLSLSAGFPVFVLVPFSSSLHMPPRSAYPLSCL